MGVQGAALATVLSRGVGTVVGLGLLFSGRVEVRPSLADLRPRPERFRRIVDVGAPLSVSEALGSLTLVVLTAVVALTGAATAIRRGADYIRIFGLTLPVYALFRVVGSAFRGSGSTRTAMGLSLLAVWVLRVPPPYLLLTVGGFGVVGLWYGMAFGNVVGTVMTVAWFLRGTWTDAIVADDTGEREDEVVAADEAGSGGDATATDGPTTTTT